MTDSQDFAKCPIPKILWSVPEVQKSPINIQKLGENPIRNGPENWQKCSEINC